MRPRQTTMLYQTAARAWLTVAIGSLALPVDVRHGVWLPLHLTLAGAVSVAISGSMQTFSAALTASGPPTTGWTVIQFALVNVGAASIAVGRSAEMTWLVAVGGATFVVAIAVLGAIVVAAPRRAVHPRHDAITGLY